MATLGYLLGETKIKKKRNKNKLNRNKIFRLPTTYNSRRHRFVYLLCLFIELTVGAIIREYGLR